MTRYETLDTRRQHARARSQCGTLGKSGQGIDCSGLVSSAYMQCGVLIYRDAKIIEGWPMHEVAFENKKARRCALLPPAMWRFIWAKGGISTPPVPPPAAVWSSTALSRATRCIGEDLVKCLYAVGSIF